MAKRRRKKKTATGHAPLLLGKLGLGVVEIAARATRAERKDITREEAWRNATADVIEKALSDNGRFRAARDEFTKTVESRLMPAYIAIGPEYYIYADRILSMKGAISDRAPAIAKTWPRRLRSRSISPTAQR